MARLLKEFTVKVKDPTGIATVIKEFSHALVIAEQDGSNEVKIDTQTVQFIVDELRKSIDVIAE